MSRSANDGHGMSEPTAEQLRQKMVAALVNNQIITDQRVEAAFRRVPRHLFLPQLSLDQVYIDRAIAIKSDSSGNTISSSSQPTMMAIMLDQMQLKPSANVLEVGTGSGYNAAIMQEIVGEEGRITSIELDRELAHAASKNLVRAGTAAVQVVQANGTAGYPPRAPYDHIIITAGIRDIAPRWIDQLKGDGSLVAPLWLDGVQVSCTFRNVGDGTLLSEYNQPCAFVYLREEEDAPQPHIVRQIGSSSLLLLADEVNRIDSAALHLLLSDDYEQCNLEAAITASEFWNGFQLYLMINEPSPYVFAVYRVEDNQSAYGIRGRGVALFSPAGAAFIAYDSGGVVDCFAGSDAYLAMQTVFDEWQALGRPTVDRLRIRVIPIHHGYPSIERGKIYQRPNCYIHVWIEPES